MYFDRQINLFSSISFRDSREKQDMLVKGVFNTYRKVIILIFLAMASGVQAIEDRADVDPNDELDTGEKISWKLTASRYTNSLQGASNDFNIRGNTENLAFWVGYYDQPKIFQQTRVGMEYSHPLPLGRLIGSIQIATENFQGWSLTWDGKNADEHGFGPLLGIGRTNLKPYYNLNFDPNDSVLIGGSFSSSKTGKIMLYQIYDDRLHTGQKVTHLVWRRSYADGKRITIDAFTRSGANAPGEKVYRGTGMTATLDLNDWFVRFGHDPNSNFSPGNIIRVALGYRY